MQTVTINHILGAYLLIHRKQFKTHHIQKQKHLLQKKTKILEISDRLHFLHDFFPQI